MPTTLQDVYDAFEKDLRQDDVPDIVVMKAESELTASLDPQLTLRKVATRLIGGALADKWRDLNSGGIGDMEGLMMDYQFQLRHGNKDALHPRVSSPLFQRRLREIDLFVARGLERFQRDVGQSVSAEITKFIEENIDPPFPQKER